MTQSYKTADERISQRFAITGMTCQVCANRLEKVLNKKPQVLSAGVNFATETLNIDYQGADTQEVLAWIKKAGFSGSLITEVHDMQANHQQGIPWRLILLWLCSLPFWVGMLGMMMGSHALMLPVSVQFMLASIVQLYFGFAFYRGAWVSIRAGLANMDVLVALGTSVIWLYSTYAWFTFAQGAHDAVYFEASVMVIAFVALGKYLEARTKQQSLNSLTMLMNLIPESLLRRQSDDWVSVAACQVSVGDVLLARAGDRIGVDGVVVSGSGLVDVAHLTGESQPITKGVGDKVLAGSILFDGSLEYQATATGEHTTLGDMVRALSEAQGTKANITRLTDKVAGIFVPVVVLISLLVFMINWLMVGVFDVALVRAVCVLVIACPCALGLATPAAIMAGIGVAAKHGVRFKDAPSLEMAGHVDTMVFDKTGTLTMAKPSIHAVYLPTGVRFEDALAITASLERYAVHPLASSIVKSALEMKLPLKAVHDVQTIIGKGLSALMDDVGVVKVGTLDFVGHDEFGQFLKDRPVGFDKNVHFVNEYSAVQDIWQIASIVAVAVDDKLLAVYALMDDVKQSAKPVIRALQQDGIDVMIMSGDAQGVVTHVANELGIVTAEGQLSPRDKAIKIKQLRQSGRMVAMVGDGVNDAPAMAEAQASFSVHDASSIAKHTASAQLIGDSLSHAYYAQKIAKATLKNIKQNLFLAFVYNVVGIAFAAVGALNPAVAAAAMALSSISVLMNALRLKRLDLKTELK